MSTRRAELGHAEPGDDDGRALDPRATRVSLAPSAAGANLAPLIVEPPSSSDPAGGRHVLRNGVSTQAELLPLDGERAILALGGTGGSRDRVLLLPPSGAAGLAPGVLRREVVIGGWRVEVELEPAARAALRERASRGRREVGHSGPTEVRAIIPGAVISVLVAPGEEVTAGRQLLVIEAMKMQNELRAPRDGTIERVAVAPGETIEVGDLLVVIS